MLEPTPNQDPETKDPNPYPDQAPKKTSTGAKATYGGIGAVLMTAVFLLWQEFSGSGTQTIPIVESIPDIKLVLGYRNGPGEVIYKNGKKIPVDGYGIAVLTKADFDRPEIRQLFGDAASTISESDFPIVVSMNGSAFDATGDLMTVRRGSDGEVVLMSNGKIDPVRLLVSNPDGKFTVYYWGNKKPEIIDKDTWFLKFARVLPPSATPKGKEPEKTAYDPKKDGLVKGKVIATGGNPPVVPVQAEIWIFAGKRGPTEKLSKADVFKTVNSDAEGSYEIAVPAGIYTVVVPVNGKLVGNAYDQKVWPQVAVETGKTVDYEFRIPKTIIEGAK